MQNFNEYVKTKRLEKEMTLRKFCQEVGLDPSNWSKIERGLGDTPKTKDIIDRISKTLNLTEDERDTLNDLALIESIPAELRPEKNVMDLLPAFFRAARTTDYDKLLRKLKKHA